MSNFAMQAVLVGCEDREKLSDVVVRTTDEHSALVNP